MEVEKKVSSATHRNQKGLEEYFSRQDPRPARSAHGSDQRRGRAQFRKQKMRKTKFYLFNLSLFLIVLLYGTQDINLQ